MRTSKKPGRVFQILAGISLNGKIAGHEGSFSAYSSPEDQQWLKKTRDESDVLLMGRKTYEKHVGKINKPMIILSRRRPGIRLDEREGVEVHWFNDSKQELLNLCDLLQYQRVTILGGAQIYHWCLEQNLVTDVFLTIEPYVFDKGKNLLEGALLTHAKSWKLSSHRLLNDDGSLLLHYQTL